MFTFAVRSVPQQASGNPDRKVRGTAGPADGSLNRTRGVGSSQRSRSRAPSKAKAGRDKESLKESLRFRADSEPETALVLNEQSDVPCAVCETRVSLKEAGCGCC